MFEILYVVFSKFASKKERCAKVSRTLGVYKRGARIFLYHSFRTFTESVDQEKCVSVSQSTSDRPESKSVTPAGSSTASSTVSSPMDR